MKSAIFPVDTYTDFQGLAALRAQARGNANSPETLQAVARQFEGLFLQMMLKSMRDASLGEGIMDSEQTGFYQEMFDQQLSMTLSHGRGLGLSGMLVRQLGGKLADSSKQDAATNAGLPPVRQSAGVKSASPVSDPVSFTSPEEFVKSLWPHAQQAGKELGVAPAALLAQAALETGWGQAIMRHPDGRSSHNLFGIKADSGWQGERLTIPALEYSEGKAVKRSEAFRVYGSFAASFEDYVNFIRGNPRYSQALAVAGDSDAFVQALQAAGYATDPAYARKVGSILRGDTFAGVFKLLSAGPLS
ncbi:MAG: flagellar assembly peptidoglycan hydrolase FlgJ [Pseudomonadota bacterium]